LYKLELNTPAGSSEILIEKGLIQKSHKWLSEHYQNSQVIVITDSNIEKIYGDLIRSHISETILTIPAKEESKDFKVVQELITKLQELGLTRSDVIIGIGGGMTTDLAGFVSSIYMRGTHYISIPTSLLGMVDAAIGGKTGINFGAKNIVGSFYFADFVWIDPTFLESFPDIKKSTGMGEIIKYAAIIDASLFENLEKEELDFQTIIQKSAQAKVNVVNQDAKEGGLRKILNFGHTFGHAIESAMNFELSHDQSISIGMVIANQVAQKLGKQKKETGDKIKKTLENFGLPTKLPEKLTIEGLADLIRKDKKRRGAVIDFVIVPELGKAEIIPLPAEELVKLAS